MPKNIIIRADGGKKIGMGHLSRAFLLSDYLIRNFSIRTVLLLKEDKEALKFLENKPLEIELLSKNAHIYEELDKIKILINKNKSSLFVLDVLENDLNNDFTDQIRSTKVPLAVITDDSYKRIINADVIINGNPCQEGINYSDEPGKYYIGAKYFIMDEKYSNMVHKKPSSKINNILLTVGGSDHNDLIFKILEALNRFENKINITLITSKGTGYVDKLKEFIHSHANSIKLLIDIPGIIDEWVNCDFSITAGGNTLFERIAARKPGVTICQLQRQMEIADKFEQKGVNYNLGFGPQLTADVIYEKLSYYLLQYDKHLNQHEIAPEVVDGKGLKRVATIFNKYIQQT